MCAIFLKQGAELVQMVEQPYEAESVLQQLLADYPNLLAGDGDRDGARRWLLVKREIGIASEESGGDRWSLDHLFLDEEGVPTLIEVKRSSDTRIRREVVGQMLDYAANGAEFWGLEKIRTAFESRYTGDAAAAALADFLGSDADPERYWERVGVNLSAGKLRLIFVADEIPAELRRIVEFLNGQMEQTEVLALEVRQYVEQGTGGRVTLVPRLIGQTEAARQTKTGGRRVSNKWGERDLLAMIAEHYPGPTGERLRALYEFMRELGARASWGSGSVPSVTMWLGEDPDPALANPLSISIYLEGVAINFRFLWDRRSAEELARLAELAREIPGVAPYLEGLEERSFGARPTMRVEDVLASDEALDAWRRVIPQALAGA